LSFPFWQRQFLADPTVVGRSLELNGWPHTIIGVAPQGFAVNAFVGGMVYVPIGPHVSTALENRRAAQFDLIGRLPSATSREEAVAALKVAVNQLEGGLPETAWREKGRSVQPVNSVVTVMPLADAVASAIAPVRAAAMLCFALAAITLALASTGLFGVVSYVVSQRTFEIGVRTALGATRATIARMIIVDGIRVVMVGCMAGLTFSWVVGRLVQRVLVAQRVMSVANLALVTVLLLTVGIVASLRPALRAAVADPIEALRHD
jgi:hypothetical protein